MSMIDKLVAEDLLNTSVMWGYLTTFFDYLKSDDRELFENYWQAEYLASEELTNKASRLLLASAPEYSNENPIENYYEIILSPLSSKPLYPDPTNKGSNYIINPIDKMLITPEYNSEFQPIYNDAILLSAKDYFNIRNVGLTCYVVVKVNNESIPDKFFPINNLLSSDEPAGRPQYAEIDQSFNLRSPPDTLIEKSLIGTLALEGFYDLGDPYYVDVSQFKVQIILTSSSTSVTWGTDYLFIQVSRSAHSSPGGEIASIMSAVQTPIGTPWCTIVNKSGSAEYAPIFIGSSFGVGSIKFHELPSFMCAEKSNGRNYPADGNVLITNDNGYSEYQSDPTKKKYLIVVNGDLSYIGDNSFNIYLTNGLAYDIDTYVTDVPYLHTHITAGYPIEFFKDQDYTFNDYVVEFNNNIFNQNSVSIGDVVYCQKTPIIENYLYESFGDLINMPDWVSYNHNNLSGKTALNSLINSLQNITNIDSYKLAMNSYYGLPISPKSGKITGLYESYSYSISSIIGNVITINLFNGEPLHPFVQMNGKFFVDGKPEVEIQSIIDRTNGVLNLVDASNLTLDDKLNIKLRNCFTLLNISMETPTDPAYIDINCPEGKDVIQHVIDVVYQTSNNTVYPEILIYNYNNVSADYNGIYHVTAAVTIGNISDNVVRLKLYKKPTNAEPLYNDYVSTSIENVVGGIVHFMWPTHKFLNIQLDDGQFFKAYLDAPIDTILDAGNVVSKYQPLSRNASVFNNSTFPDWFQYDQFKKYCGINRESDVLETTREFKYADFGKYFPCDYSRNSNISPVSNITLYQNTYLTSGVTLLQNTYIPYLDRASGLPDWQNTYNQGAQ